MHELIVPVVQDGVALIGQLGSILLALLCGALGKVIRMLAWPNILIGYGDILVPVRAGMGVDEAQAVQQLMHYKNHKKKTVNLM